MAIGLAKLINIGSALTNLPRHPKKSGFRCSSLQSGNVRLFSHFEFWLPFVYFERFSVWGMGNVYGGLVVISQPLDQKSTKQ